MTGYQLSRFSVTQPVKIKAEELTCVYNTLTKALFVMPSRQWIVIVTAESGVDPETIRDLIQAGVLVNKGVKETLVFKEWRSLHVHDFSLIKSKVLVTRKCNNRCTYCILDAEAKDMTAETAREMDNFYLDQIEKNCPKKVRDDYLGGEPLLNPGVIFESASRRHFFCAGRGIDYGFSVTTNGTQIETGVIARLKDIGLKSLRVSLA